MKPVLIGMATWNGEWNNRFDLTLKTIQSLRERLNLKFHRLVISDNGSTCKETIALLQSLEQHEVARVIWNKENLGTARAINQAWILREAGQHCVKMDNDVVVHENGWLDRLVDCVEKEPRIGILGLKRKDVDEWPSLPIGTHAQYKSTLVDVPHKKGDRWWHVVERCNHVMGTCQLYSSSFLDKVGYLYQLGLKYAFDDSLMAARAKKTGFWSCFYPAIEIDHIDPGGDQATQDKIKVAGEHIERFKAVEREYLLGLRPAWQGPMDD